jgi:hypothetical protein
MYVHSFFMLEESVFVKIVAECCFDYNPHRHRYIVTWCNVFGWDLIKTGRVPNVTEILQIATKRFRFVMRSWRSVKISCLLLWNFWNAYYDFPHSSHDVCVSNKAEEAVTLPVLMCECDPGSNITCGCEHRAAETIWSIARDSGGGNRKIGEKMHSEELYNSWIKTFAVVWMLYFSLG